MLLNPAFELEHEASWARVFMIKSLCLILEFCIWVWNTILVYGFRPMSGLGHDPFVSV